MKKIGIIGAGPGGLASAMLLVHKGYEVHVYDKNKHPGGRSRRVTLGDYHFDLGPTFLMYVEILREVFQQSGFDLDQTLELIRLDPLYKLSFKDHVFSLRSEPKANQAIFESYQKGLGKSYMKWLSDQEQKLKRIQPILEKPFRSKKDYLSIDVLKALPILHPLKSVYQSLRTYAKTPYFIHALSFQAKYLGMASYQAPSIFTFLPYLEHQLGLYHVTGGLHQIHEKMKALATAKGVVFHMETEVKQIMIEDGVARGIIIHPHETHLFDHVVLNADFAYAMHHLIDPKNLKTWTPRKIETKKFSISTLMIYLGLDQTYPFAHHEIIFSKDYDHYLKELMAGKLSDDISYYVHNPSAIDQSLAPLGHSSLYILIPVPNLRTDINWDLKKEALKAYVINDLESRYDVSIAKHVQTEMMLTPKDWSTDENVHIGAVFNLSHSLDQMLEKRPHNQFEDIKELYLVGGGTHPGSGLPTIYQSALILASIL